MSMDTTFPDNKLMYRAVTSPLAWQITYALIIATQIVCGVLFLAGAIGMWRAALCRRRDFHRAKTLRHRRGALAFLLWFFVFMVIAGEWFAMWQSKDWNAQASSFRFYITVLAVLIFLNQPDPNLPASETEPS